MSNLKLPVQHLSYSSIRLLLTNPAIFKKRYIDFIWDDKKSPALVEGSAVHAVLAEFYKLKKEGKENEFKPVEATKRAVDKEIIAVKDEVDWGKTGKVEKSIRDVENTVTYYFADAKIHNPVSVEESFVVDVADDMGTIMPVALKGRFDLIARDEDGGFYAVDHKTVSSFSEEEAEKPDYKIQAVICYLIMKHAENIELKFVQFDEIKKSVKPVKEGNVQSIRIEITPDLIFSFFILLKRIINHLSVFDRIKPLPNVFDFLGGDEAWLDFKQECDFLARKQKERAAMSPALSTKSEKDFAPAKE